MTDGGTDKMAEWP